MFLGNPALDTLCAEYWRAREIRVFNFHDRASYPVAGRAMAAEPKPSRRSEPTRALGEADDVRLYLEAAAREPLLTKEEEVELAMAIERGEEAEARLQGGRLKSETSIRKAKEAVRK